MDWRIFLLLLFMMFSSSLSSDEEIDEENKEKDHRLISYNDLLASGGARFADEGVTSFGELLFSDARREIFVGCRDTLYKLSMMNLALVEKVTWPATSDKFLLCQDKGQSEENCHNFIKVLLSNGQKLLACGTNGFSPICSWRELGKMENVLSMVKGIAKCPYNPNANITALITSDNHYYVGTPTDFSGSDYAIYRAIGTSDNTLRTNQYNLKYLNEPQFVGSFEDSKFVYFVFREAAIEYINCGKRIFSRIARVCKNDSGGQVMLKDNWTTFIKARLNCSSPGDYPFYYDEIQDMHYLPEQRILYGAFSTGTNSLAGAAICAFNMSAIEDVFVGPFKHQETPGHTWESINVSHQFHTQCQTRSGSPKSPELFKYQLMDRAVQPTTLEPLHKIEQDRFTHISVAEVDSRFATTHILFAATASGKINKISLIPRKKLSCVIEIWQVYNENQTGKIKTMHFNKITNSIFVGTELSVLKIPIERCSRYIHRYSCLEAQDPLCGWDERREACTGPPIGSKNHWVQNLPSCPDTSTSLDGGWSAWSLWEECLQKDVGETMLEEAEDKCMCQTRRCNNPHPRNGGKKCEGLSIRVTNCTVHGGWTAWSGWSACSASCGVAVKWRRRTCGAPAPSYGGRLCVGPDRSEIYCTQNPPCPVPVQPIQEPGWSDWSSWSSCSAPCGGGARWRQRKCDNPPPVDGGTSCSGCSVEAEACNKQPCETKRATAWTPWQATHAGNFSQGYVEKRYRFSCKAQTTDNVKLIMSKEEERFCSGNGSCGFSATLETSGGWSQWGPWDICSVECGGGYQTATRFCLKPPCEGSAKIQKACNTHSCVDGWGCWNDWSPCSSTCGPGRMERRRTCLAPGGCKGNGEQISVCNGPPCEGLIGWSDWSVWSPCDSDNKQHRRRMCLISFNTKEIDCQGPDTETRVCGTLDTSEVNLFDISAEKSIHRQLESSLLASGLSTGAVIGLAVAALLIGSFLTAAPFIWFSRRKQVRIPSSPHYMSKQNSYVSVPLKEVPRKRPPSFSSIRSSISGLTLTKPNNITTDKNQSGAGTTKLYPKAFAGEYETGTIKKSSQSNNMNCKNNVESEEDKFY